MGEFGYLLLRFTDLFLRDFNVIKNTNWNQTIVVMSYNRSTKKAYCPKDPA